MESWLCHGSGISPRSREGNVPATATPQTGKVVCLASDLLLTFLPFYWVLKFPDQGFSFSTVLVGHGHGPSSFRVVDPFEAIVGILTAGACDKHEQGKGNRGDMQ